jgi:hypothetical protein
MLMKLENDMVGPLLRRKEDSFVNLHRRNARRGSYLTEFFCFTPITDMPFGASSLPCRPASIQLPPYASRED